MFSLLFFFQAEDGIRDLVRSRGLGDVYKSQGRELLRKGILALTAREKFLRHWLTDQQTNYEYMAVSYTHLTLPTSDLV